MIGVDLIIGIIASLGAAHIKDWASGPRKRKELKEKLRKAIRENAEKLEISLLSKPIREQLRDIGPNIAELKEILRIPSDEKDLLKLLKDPVFCDGMADWIEEPDPEKTKQAGEKIWNRMLEVIPHEHLTESEIEEKKKEYFGIIENVVFSSSPISFYRITRKLDAATHKHTEILETGREVLKREESIQRDIEKILNLIRERLSNHLELEHPVQRYEKRYLEYIYHTYSRIRVLGVSEVGKVKQKLSMAYVTLRIKSDENGKGKVFNTSSEKILSDYPLLTIRGLAGSGKTTLLQWIMLQSAGNYTDSEKSYEGELSENALYRLQWKGYVPFYIPLKKLKNKQKGKPDQNRFIEYADGEVPFGEKPPDGWINDVLKIQKRGVILIDGLDEIPPEYRPNFWKWLDEFTYQFPGNRIIITSRYFPDTEQTGNGKISLWNPPGDFHEAELDEMNIPDIREFIKRWHNAVLEFEKDPQDQAVLEKRRDELPEKIFDPQNRRIFDLCRIPLLCSMICALHWREEGFLPTERVKLYERCCDMLIEERDWKREVQRLSKNSPIRMVTKNEKEKILRNMAWLMMSNKMNPKDRQHSVQITFDQGMEWTRSIIKDFKNKKARENCSPRQVLNHLITATSLLQEPSKGYLDFPHRTFQEYLAACYAGGKDDYGSLADRAGNDLWHETIILAAGTRAGGESFGRRLIARLLEKGENKDDIEERRFSCLALAVACLETAQDVDSNLRERILKHLDSITPPRNKKHARALAPAGNSLLEPLRYDQIKNENKNTIISCIHALVLVGSREAMRELEKKYSHNENEEIISAICSVPGINPLELEPVCEYIKKKGKFPEYALPYIKDLNPLKKLKELTSLMIGGPFKKSPLLEDLSPLEELKSLKVLKIIDCPNFTDLSQLKNLKSLEQLDLVVTGVKDFSPLQNLHSLKVLYLSTKGFTDLSPLKNLKSLEILYLEVTGVKDLSPLQSLQSLEILDLRGTGVKDLSPLQSLQSLEILDISGIYVTDLSPLQNLKSMEKLDLEGTGVKDLSPLKNLQSLEHLDIQRTGVTDLSPLKNLQSLKTLLIGVTNITSIPPEMDERVKEGKLNILGFKH